MPEDAKTLKDNLTALMKILATLNAQEEIIGKGVIGVMYQTGKSVGVLEGEKIDHAGDLATALDLIAKSGMAVWNIELWKDKGQKENTFEEEGVKKAWLVFRDCPIRQVCLTEGVAQDGAMCRISYGLFAGILSNVLGQKLDIKPVETGPNACKKLVEWR